jgi:hypothetical protein
MTADHDTPPGMLANIDQCVAMIKDRLDREIAATRKTLTDANGDTLVVLVHLTALMNQVARNEPWLVSAVLSAALVRLAEAEQG